MNTHRLINMAVVLMGITLFYTHIDGVAAELSSNDSHNFTLNDVKEFHSNFIHSGSSSRLSITETKAPEISQLLKGNSIENRTIDGSTELHGLVSMNTERQRDLTYRGGIDGTWSRTNYMDIEVRQVTVIAINTASGGKAMATSNIVLQPVQNTCNHTCNSGTAFEEKLG